MRMLSIIAIVVAAVSTLLGIISRLMLKPIVVEAHAFLQFSSVCLLFAIALVALKLLEKK